MLYLFFLFFKVFVKQLKKKKKALLLINTRIIRCLKYMYYPLQITYSYLLLAHPRFSPPHIIQLKRLF